MSDDAKGHGNETYDAPFEPDISYFPDIGTGRGGGWSSGMRVEAPSPAYAPESGLSGPMYGPESGFAGPTPEAGSRRSIGREHLAQLKFMQGLMLADSNDPDDKEVDSETLIRAAESLADIISQISLEIDIAGKDAHAGLYNNLGCAYAYNNNLDAARDQFWKAANDPDIKDGGGGKDIAIHNLEILDKFAR